MGRNYDGKGREGRCVFYHGEVGGAENAEVILDLGYGRRGCMGLGGSYAPCALLFSLYLVIAGQRADTRVRPYTGMVVG